MTQPDSTWSPEDDDDEYDDPRQAPPWTALAGLAVVAFALLQVVGAIYDLRSFTQEPRFGQPALDGRMKLRYIAQLTLTDDVSLALALGLVAVGFVISARDGLATIERAALLVIAGTSGAIALLVAVALYLDLDSGRTLREPFTWHSRAELAFGVLMRLAVAAAALGLAQHFGDLDDDLDDLDDLDLGDDEGEDGAVIGEHDGGRSGEVSAGGTSGPAEVRGTWPAPPPDVVEGGPGRREP